MKTIVNIVPYSVWYPGDSKSGCAAFKHGDWAWWRGPNSVTAPLHCPSCSSPRYLFSRSHTENCLQCNYAPLLRPSASVPTPKGEEEEDDGARGKQKRWGGGNCSIRYLKYSAWQSIFVTLLPIPQGVKVTADYCCCYTLSSGHKLRKFIVTHAPSHRRHNA